MDKLKSIITKYEFMNKKDLFTLFNSHFSIKHSLTNNI